jgi:hypothetical protein
MSFRKVGIVSVVIILMFLSLVPLNVSAVEYSLSYTDPSGDPEGILVEDQTTKDMTDILQITSALSGNDIVLTMKVTGTIYTTGFSYFSGYQFNLDIDDDQTMDWLVTTSSIPNFNGTDSQLQDDEEFILKYLENSTGHGTNTLTVKFPQAYITEEETIESWNIYATASVSNITSGASYVDTAPDDEFGEGTPADDDTDDDGIPDDYEDANGMDKNDPNDAAEDNDNDGYTNLQEYNEGTNPNDDQDYPGSGTGPDNDGDDIPDDTDDDDDNDGMPDSWETLYGLKPKDASDANQDKDNDGYTNLWEYTMGSDPTDPFDPDSGGDGDGGGTAADPATETATDTSISTAITKATFQYDEDGDYIKINVQIQGTTSGVDHCELMIIAHYEDGTKDTDLEWEEAFDYTSDPAMANIMKQMGYDKLHFKKTSDGWKTWEYAMSGRVKKSEFLDDNDTSEDNKPTKMVIWIRAYSDAGETNWNQASKTQSVSIGGGGDGDGGGEGFLPGFETVAITSAFIITILVIAVSNRRKR